MSVSRDHGDVVFSCDSCPEVLDTQTKDWDEAWGIAQYEGWRFVDNGPRGKSHICKVCASEKGIE